jgi:hypothetical protein
MNKFLLFSLLALLGMTQLSAQEYEYVPFVREGVKWVYLYSYCDQFFEPTEYGKVWLTLEIKGDTVINGKTYKAMHKYFGDAINEENDTIPVYLREENKVVYGIVPDGILYPDCMIGIARNLILHNQIINGEEFVLYDFLDPETFWSSYLSEDDLEGFALSDTIRIGNHLAKKYDISGFGNDIFIEGIGFDSYGNGYTIYPFMPMFVGGFGYDYYLFSHVVENDEIIYKALRYERGGYNSIGEMVADQSQRVLDENYYNLMGQPVGKELPTTPGIYIHQGKKICVSQTH